ncbi:MAG: sensor histidine kinase N-terminal domain-containing protein [Rhodospirillales bacterium]|nr:sensor histidine kinase N-terminal domain-containing protein [Rhodospirillales bacterium]
MAWLLVPLAVLALYNLWTAYAGVRRTADLITNRTLLASARVIAEQVKDSDGVVEALIPPAALEMFDADEPDKVIYRVTGPDGELVAGYPDVLVPPHPPAGLQPMFFRTEFRGEGMRAVAIAQPIVTRQATRNALVVVGQSLHGRDRLLSDLWLPALRDQLSLIGAAAVLILFGLQRGLAPLLRLRDAVLARTPRQLQPLDAASVQSELQPLVHALNHAFARIHAQMATRQRFIANASHQLRTPLALLKTQARVGLRDADPAGKDEALRGVDATGNAMARLVNQLLTLARAEQGGEVIRMAPVDLAAVVAEALASLAGPALARGLTLDFETDGAPAPMNGHAALLQEMVFNLADNACRHAPAGGIVLISLHRQGDHWRLRVEDNGPGIPVAERELVLERFYRLPDTPGDGSGLGLAIVREIAEAHGGGVTLGERQPPPGLVVEVLVRAGPPGLSSSRAVAPGATSPAGSRSSS